MRRSVAAICGTVIGTALMIGAKLAHPGADDLVIDPAAQGEVADIGQDPAGPTDVATTATPAPAPSGRGAASPVPGGSPQPSTAPRPGSSTRPAAGTAPAPQPSPAGRYRDGTFAGNSVTEKYGVIKVKIAVSGGKITKASATCTNPCRGESDSISRDAFAKLNPRVVAAQSAAVNSVSGATYTHNAYKQSLAAAINLAKA
jgi:uncharacterized protein with FMN-binding domain